MIYNESIWNFNYIGILYFVILMFLSYIIFLGFFDKLYFGSVKVVFCFIYIFRKFVEKIFLGNKDILVIRVNKLCLDEDF